MEESIAATDGVGSGEQLVTMVSESSEMPGATVGATESSKTGAGATDVMPESATQRPVASESMA